MSAPFECQRWFILEVSRLDALLRTVRAMVGSSFGDVPLINHLGGIAMATLLFANFAEAVAEGRGKVQAATLRKARTNTRAKRLIDSNGRSGMKDVVEGVSAVDLQIGDVVLVEAGDLIPSEVRSIVRPIRKRGSHSMHCHAFRYDNMKTATAAQRAAGFQSRLSWNNREQVYDGQELNDWREREHRQRMEELFPEIDFDRFK